MSQEKYQPYESAYNSATRDPGWNAGRNSGKSASQKAWDRMPVAILSIGAVLIIALAITPGIITQHNELAAKKAEMQAIVNIAQKALNEIPEEKPAQKKEDLSKFISIEGDSILASAPDFWKYGPIIILPKTTAGPQEELHAAHFSVANLSYFQLQFSYNAARGCVVTFKQPRYGQVEWSGGLSGAQMGIVHYIPQLGFTGVDSFTYRVADATNPNHWAEARVDIQMVNQ